MSQTPASQAENDLFQAFKEEVPELLKLACHVAFVPRVEQRLLRGIRMAFLPHLSALFEYQLWFSDLVHARNTSNFIFSPGMVGLLVEMVRDDPGLLDLDVLWHQCQVLTRHWKPLDRLERDLYFFALNRDSDGLKQVYRDMLRLISSYTADNKTQQSKLLELSRRIKYSTAILSDEQVNFDVGKHLVNFAFESLHDPGDWSDDVAQVRLPDWMKAAIPERKPESLAVELRHDATKGKNIIYFSKPVSGQETIEFNTPLPARLHIRAAGFHRSWVRVNHGSLFEMDAESTQVEMTTRSGKHYRLEINQIPEPSPQIVDVKPRLYLAFSKADENRALQIQQWLKTQDINVDLIEEKPGSSTSPVTDQAIRVLRLWSQGMQRLWNDMSKEQQSDSMDNLLLKIDDIQAPSGFSSPGRVVDIRNWEQESSHELAYELAERIGNWVKRSEEENKSGHDVFITYSRQGKEFSYDVQKHLESHDISVQLVDDVIASNESWSERLHEALENSECLVAIFTEDLVRSARAMDELGIVSSLGKMIIPIRIGEAEIRHVETMIQAIEFAKEPLPWDELIRSCEMALGRDETTEDDLFNELLKRLENLQTTPEERLKIGDQLAELGDSRPGVGVREYEIVEYPPEIKALLDEIDNSETKPDRRLEIGDELAQLVDQRPGVGVDENGLPDIDWVEIPAGEFIYGEGEEQQRLSLDSFFIALYPITNAQYQAFIDDGGYEEERWWRGLEKQSPEKSSWNQANRPKETVSWYEAVAFCRWLSQQLGYEIHLPTEQEWEKAARGTDGREYPWGKGYRAGYANVNEKRREAGASNLVQTTAVGFYPQGASPYDVMDMAGNVWEWCLNKYDEPDDTAIDESGDHRVLRGGSWFFNLEDARAASRFRDLPDGRLNDWGFRVVCVSPIVR